MREIAALVTQMARKGHRFISGTGASWDAEGKVPQRPPLGDGDVWSAAFGGGRIAFAARLAAPHPTRSSHDDDL